MEEEKSINATYVFRGFYFDEYRDKLYEDWRNVDNTDKALYFEHTPKRSRSILLTVGGLYGVHAEEGTAIWKDRRHTELWSNKEERVKWDAMSRSHKQQFEAFKRAGRESGYNSIREAVQPIRAAYHGMAGPQKAQLIADVIRYITG